MFENLGRRHVLIGGIVVTGFIILNFYSFYKPRKPFNMDGQDVFKYFGTEDGLDITWYHRANNLERFGKAMSDEGVKMIEVDVVFAKLSPEMAKLQPVLGHSKEDKFDLTAYHFIDIMIAQKKRKGIKLDFKELEAVEPTLRYLFMKNAEIDFPVWLNADTTPGPGGAKEQVDGKRFLNLVKEYCPEYTVSLGFTYSAPNTTPLTQSMVQEMYQLARETTQPITFAINVAMFVNSLSPVSWLMHQEPERFTVTLWTSALKQNWEGADPEAILKVRNDLSKKVLFYDLSDNKDTWHKFLKLSGKE